MWLEIVLTKDGTPADPADFVTSFYPAEAFVKEIEFELGGQKIDKQYSDWYRIYDELFRSSDEKAAYRRLTDFNDPAGTTDEVKRFYLPLLFSFNRHPGLALPLIALQVSFWSISVYITCNCLSVHMLTNTLYYNLQYHEAKLHFTFASSNEMAAAGIKTSVDPQVSLYATYVFLDTDER